MALDFGKLNFSVSFNPTSAFPIDARSYFESLAAAEAAALTAKPAGDFSTQYYYGQTLVVVENSVASFYIIQPDNTLAPVGGNIDVDPSVFEYDGDGNLSLKGFGSAKTGQVLTVSEDGSLYFASPVDAYSKGEVYTRQETELAINTALAKVEHLKRKIVSSVEEIDTYLEDADVTQYIFLVPIITAELKDSYDEYMVIETAIVDSEGIETKIKQVEKLGSWEVDLTGYAKTSDIELLLNNKVDKVENARLITEDELTKLFGIQEGAEVNAIQSVSANFTIDENRQLSLNDLPVGKVTGLEALLNSKVDKQDGWTLLSPDDQKKLNKLVIGEGDNIEISGKVNASNVEGLPEWITNASTNYEISEGVYGTLPGLSKNNFTDELQAKLTSSLLITAVEETELKVENNKLSVVSIDKTKVVGLEAELNAKADQTTVEAQATKIASIEDQLNTYVDKTTYEADIAELKDALTWKSL